MASDEAARQASDVLRRFDYSNDGRLQFEEFASWFSAITASQDEQPQPPQAAPAVVEEEETVVETRLSGFLYMRSC